MSPSGIRPEIRRHSREYHFTALAPHSPPRSAAVASGCARVLGGYQPWAPLCPTIHHSLTQLESVEVVPAEQFVFGEGFEHVDALFARVQAGDGVEVFAAGFEEGVAALEGDLFERLNAI